MQYSFPKETVKLLVNLTKRNIKEQKLPSFKLLEKFTYWLSQEHIYGFENNLRTGEYAPFFHQMLEKKIPTYNCTTIIPTLYIKAKELGYNPQIVQFEGFKDFDLDGIIEQHSFEESRHYALLCYEKTGDLIIVDPFYNTFGRAIPGSNHFDIFGSEKFPSIKRIYQNIYYFSAQEFTTMMERLQEPAHSLDMLIPGQKAKDCFGMFGWEVDLKVYYDPNKNTLTTRLYVPEIGISDKTIFCHQILDKLGNVKDITYELFHTKSIQWSSINGRSVARLSQIGLENLFDLQTYLNKTNSLSIKLNDLDIDLYLCPIQLTDQEKSQLEKPNCVRTLYELAIKNKQQEKCDEFVKSFLYPVNELDSICEDLLDELKKIKEEYERKDKIFNLYNFSDESYLELLILKNKHDKKREELKDLITLRKNSPYHYARNMSMVNFARSLTKDQLEKDINPNLGHLATIIDFIPYIMQSYGELKLQEFMPSIQEKIKARFL